MLKNLVIIVLVIVSAVMSYKYLTLYNNVKAVQKQDVITDIYNTGTIRLYRYSEMSYYVEDEDKKLLIFFIYDTNGLQTISIQDYLTDKSIAFNISEEGVLGSYLYEDKKYRVVTNIVGVQPEILIQRAEWYNGYRVNYEFLPDGSTNLAVNSAGLGE